MRHATAIVLAVTHGYAGMLGWLAGHTVGARDAHDSTIGFDEGYSEGYRDGSRAAEQAFAPFAGPLEWEDAS